MQRQRGELVPVGEALSGMDGPVKAIRAAAPQARHYFTLADQVGQLSRGPRSGPGERLHGANNGYFGPCQLL